MTVCLCVFNVIILIIFIQYFRHFKLDSVNEFKKKCNNKKFGHKFFFNEFCECSRFHRFEHSKSLHWSWTSLCPASLFLTRGSEYAWSRKITEFCPQISHEGLVPVTCLDVVNYWSWILDRNHCTWFWMFMWFQWMLSAFELKGFRPVRNWPLYSCARNMFWWHSDCILNDSYPPEHLAMVIWQFVICLSNLMWWLLRITPSFMSS